MAAIDPTMDTAVVESGGARLILRTDLVPPAAVLAALRGPVVAFGAVEVGPPLHAPGTRSSRPPAGRQVAASATGGAGSSGAAAPAAAAPAAEATDAAAAAEAEAEADVTPQIPHLRLYLLREAAELDIAAHEQVLQMQQSLLAQAGLLPPVV